MAEALFGGSSVEAVRAARSPHTSRRTARSDRPKDGFPESLRQSILIEPGASSVGSVAGALSTDERFGASRVGPLSFPCEPAKARRRSPCASAMREGELQANVMRAVALARDAMEQDASEARARGWGKGGPDSASVATLAAGLLITNAIATAAAESESAARAGNRRMRRGRPPDYRQGRNAKGGLRRPRANLALRSTTTDRRRSRSCSPD
jgi:hypothetical protein